MATMRYEVFDAFRAAGLSDDRARAAAEVITQQHKADSGDIETMRQRLARLDRQLVVIKWMIGLVIAVQVVPLLRHLL